MRSSLTTISTMIMVTLLVGCTDDNLVVLSVIGRWDWVSSSGGIFGRTDTPSTTGHKIMLEISKNSFRKFIDDQLVNEAEYTFETRKSRHDQMDHLMIVMDNGWKMTFRRNGNRLYLMDECDDCFTSVYQLDPHQ